MSALRNGPTLVAANGAQLAEIRKQLGLTQIRLSAATGLSRDSISQIECGRPVALDVLRRYVTGLGGHVDVVARIGSTWLNVA
jgi:transcriptional regulator with XRE-family HTH domain